MILPLVTAPTDGIPNAISVSSIVGDGGSGGKPSFSYNLKIENLINLKIKLILFTISGLDKGGDGGSGPNIV